MFINRLVVKDVRNLTSVDLNGFKKINLLKGRNASGKTAFLEAISLLSVGRSFRTRAISSVVSRDQSLLSIYGECISEQNQVFELGLSRDKEKNFTIRINGETAPSLASLSYCLPTQIFNSDVLLLIEGASSERLTFIDWGVFHVEHSFLSLWRLHKKHLSQRNLLLKQANLKYQDLLSIDEQLAKVGIQIEQLRYQYLHNFLNMFKRVSEENGFSLGEQIKFVYADGWRISRKPICENEITTLSLSSEEIIKKQENSFERDRKKKYTSYHAGKSELIIMLDTCPAKQFLSRGEMKTLCFFLKVAQAIYLNESMHLKPIFLVDDLGAELDQENFNLILRMLLRYGFQSFISVTDNLDMKSLMEDKINVQMFHVEHGKINPL